MNSRGINPAVYNFSLKSGKENNGYVRKEKTNGQIWIIEKVVCACPLSWTLIETQFTRKHYTPFSFQSLPATTFQRHINPNGSRFETEISFTKSQFLRGFRSPKTGGRLYIGFGAFLVIWMLSAANRVLGSGFNAITYLW